MFEFKQNDEYFQDFVGIFFGLERLGDSNHFIQKFDLSSIAAIKNKTWFFLGYAFKISVIPYRKIEPVRRKP